MVDLEMHSLPSCIVAAEVGLDHDRSLGDVGEHAADAAASVGPRASPSAVASGRQLSEEDLYTRLESRFSISMTRTPGS